MVWLLYIRANLHNTNSQNVPLIAVLIHLFFNFSSTDGDSELKPCPGPLNIFFRFVFKRGLGCGLFSKFLEQNPILIDRSELSTKIKSYTRIWKCFPLPLSNFRYINFTCYCYCNKKYKFRTLLYQTKIGYRGLGKGKRFLNSARDLSTHGCACKPLKKGRTLTWLMGSVSNIGSLDTAYLSLS